MASYSSVGWRDSSFFTTLNTAGVSKPTTIAYCCSLTQSPLCSIFLKVTADPEPMGEALDASFLSNLNKIDLEMVTQLKPNAAHRATETIHSARVGGYVKPPSNARPLDGWPAYNPAGPESSLATVPLVNCVFPDTFGIWATTRCLCHIARPARLHEVLF
jgi:hypothetical protein